MVRPFINGDQLAEIYCHVFHNHPLSSLLIAGCPLQIDISSVDLIGLNKITYPLNLSFA
jgi:hypothetical protein